MPRTLLFISIFDLIGVFIDINPVELGRVIANGADEAFALPFRPVGARVREEVASEGVAGGCFEFEVFVDGDVVVDGVGDKKLELVSRTFSLLAPCDGLCLRGRTL